MSQPAQKKKLTIADLRGMKERGEPIAVTTAHDYVTTKLVDEAEIDAVLVSDWSVATSVLGYATALQAKWDEVLFYLQGVCRIVEHAVVIGSLPFGSYHVSDAEAVRNAARLMKAGADTVKVEGAGPIIDRAHAISQAGILCVGHLGATPHSVKRRSGLCPFGQKAEEAAQLVKDAQALAQAGAWAIMLEGVPDRVAEIVCRKTNAIIIGAGGTSDCDGQMLTIYSILGMPEAVSPLFSRQYADFEGSMLAALNAWCAEVRNLEFPTEKQTFDIKDEQFERFLEVIN